MHSELILAEQHNAVYQIIINRPDKLNALTDVCRSGVSFKNS